MFFEVPFYEIKFSFLSTRCSDRTRNSYGIYNLMKDFLIKKIRKYYFTTEHSIIDNRTNFEKSFEIQIGFSILIRLLKLKLFRWHAMNIFDMANYNFELTFLFQSLIHFDFDCYHQNVANNRMNPSTFRKFKLIVKNAIKFCFFQEFNTWTPWKQIQNSNFIEIHFKKI